MPHREEVNHYHGLSLVGMVNACHAVLRDVDRSGTRIRDERTDLAERVHFLLLAVIQVLDPQHDIQDSPENLLRLDPRKASLHYRESTISGLRILINVLTMNKEEAIVALQSAAARLRGKAQADLIGLIDAPSISTHVSASGRRYTIEVSAVWDDRKSEVLRLQLMVDDGGLRAFVPMVRGALIARHCIFDGEIA